MFHFQETSKKNLAQKTIVCALSASMILQPMSALAAQETNADDTTSTPATDQESAVTKLIKQAVETGHLATQADKNSVVAEAARLVALAKEDTELKHEAVIADGNEMAIQQEEMAAQKKNMADAEAEARKIMSDYAANLESAKKTVQDEIDKLTKEKTGLEKQKDTLPEQLQAKKDELKKLEDELNKLSSDDAQTAKDEADKALADAQAQKETAEKAVKDTEAAIVEAKKQAQDIENQLTDANQQLTDATAKLNEKTAKLNDLKAKLTEAQAAEKEAKDNNTPCVDQEEVKRLEDEINNIENQDLPNVNVQITQLNARIAQLTEEQTQTQARVDTLNTEIATKQQEVKDSQARIVEIEQQKKDAEASAAAKEAELESNKQKISDAETKRDELKKEYKELEDQKAAAEKRIKEIDTQIEGLNKASEDAKAIGEKVAKWKSQGIAGFYEWYAENYHSDANQALQILKGEDRYNLKVKGTDTTFASYTHLGEEGDATSISNVESAIKLIKMGNTLRSTAEDKVTGANPVLQISFNLMALAQVNANWSARTQTINHASKYGQASSWAENAAWGSHSDTNLAGSPYNGWYSIEKKVFDYLQQKGIKYASIANNTVEKQKISDELGLPGADFVQIGHYTNLMEKTENPTVKHQEYKYTGFGRSTVNGTPYGVADVQTFNAEQDAYTFSGGKIGVIKGVTLTVDQFEARLNEYKQVLADNDKDPSTEIAELEKEKTKLDTKVNDLGTKLTAKQAEVDVQQKQADDLTDANIKLTDQIETLKQKTADGEQEAAQLQQKIDAANATITADQEELTKKNANLAQQTEELKKEEAERDALSEKKAELDAKIDQARTELVTAKSGSYKPYEDATQAAQNAVNEQDKLVNEAQTAKNNLDATIAELNKSKDVTAQKQSEFEITLATQKEEQTQKAEAAAKAEEIATKAGETLAKTQKRDELAKDVKGTQKKLDDINAKIIDSEKNLADKTAEQEKLNATALDPDLAWEKGFAKAPARRMRRAAVSPTTDGTHPRTNLDAGMIDSVEELRAKYAEAKDAYDKAQAAYAEAVEKLKVDDPAYRAAYEELQRAEEVYNKVLAAIVDGQATEKETKREEPTKQANYKPKHLKDDKKDKENLPETSDPSQIIAVAVATLGSLSTLGYVASKRKRI